MTLEKRLQQYIQAGNTGVSNDLLLHYQDVGLDNDDLALYMQVERIKGGEIKLHRQLLPK
jgi:DNA replication protein